MKGKGIRNRLIGSFFFIIASLFIFDAFLFFMHIALIKKYQDITGNMITEYQVATTADDLVSSYNETVKLIQDPQQMAKYNAIVTEIDAIFAKLDVTITNEKSQSAYVGLKNTVQDLVAGLDSGIKEAKTGDILDTNIYYNSALQQEDFVHQNTATLIFDELDYTEQVQAEIAREEFAGEVFGGLILLLLIIGAIVYAVSFSKKITAPITNLALLAKDIAGGDLDATVDPDLLIATDEVGSLANSFNVMVGFLRKNIHELDSEKKVVEEKVRMRTRELIEERAQLLASINSLPLGFLLLDTANIVLLSNAMVRDILPREDLTFASLCKLFVPAFDPQEFSRLMKERQSYELLETKLGEKSFHVMAMPVVISKSGEPDETIGSVLLFEDITKEKTLDESKNTFLAIAAHEMRTPLTVIRGNAELLLDEPIVNANAGFKGQIEGVLRAAVRLLDIVNDFLDVQNLEGKRVSLNVEPVDVVAVLGEAMRDLSLLAQKKGLTLTLNVAPGLSIPPIDLDKRRLQQIFINIIGNAIHYTNQGGITIILQKEGSNAKIFFEDTGIGISTEEKGRLFKKFETGRVFMKSKEYGSGLGLYISHFLACLMGGDLVLERSDVGKGSVFCLILPLGGIAKR